MEHKYVLYLNIAQNKKCYIIKNKIYKIYSGFTEIFGIYKIQTESTIIFGHFNKDNSFIGKDLYTSTNNQKYTYTNLSLQLLKEKFKQHYYILLFLLLFWVVHVY